MICQSVVAVPKPEKSPPPYQAPVSTMIWMSYELVTCMPMTACPPVLPGLVRPTIV